MLPLEKLPKQAICGHNKYQINDYAWAYAWGLNLGACLY